MSIVVDACRRAVLGYFLAICLSSVAIAAEDEPVKASVAAPLREVQELAAQKKYAEVMQRLPRLDAIDGLNNNEISYIERFRVVAAINTADLAVAATSLKRLLATGKLNEQDRDSIEEMLVAAQMRNRDYKTAAAFTDEYLASGGKSYKIRVIGVKAIYLSGDYVLAAKRAHILSDEAIAEGKAPEHELLKIEASCYLKLDDAASYTGLLTRLVAYYPSTAYWRDLLERLRDGDGFTRNDKLESYRLQMAVGAIQGADDYFEMAELAMKAGYPAEAMSVLWQGENAHLFADPGQKARYTSLRAAVEKMLADDLKLLSAPQEKADSNQAISNGFNLALNGRQTEGISLMQRALALGNLRHPEEARLHLAYAIFINGDKKLAQTEFSSLREINGNIGIIARLWATCLESQMQPLNAAPHQ